MSYTGFESLIVMAITFPKYRNNFDTLQGLHLVPPSFTLPRRGRGPSARAGFSYCSKAASKHETRHCILYMPPQLLIRINRLCMPLLAPTSPLYTRMYVRPLSTSPRTPRVPAILSLPQPTQKPSYTVASHLLSPFCTAAHYLPVCSNVPHPPQYVGKHLG